ncbi:MAG: hypothetical protein IJO46_12115 [Thermoguttaceae bacterium]|nr:hypothetical protein [Thermoguttaceae bacterium]
MPNETAVLVLSGKILDVPFPLTTLDAIRTAIERETSARGIAVQRRVATLAPSRFFVAPEFLKAGFEIVPADDEDVQATALLFHALDAPTPATEVLFALGIPEPLELLRALAGRTRRVLLTTDAVSPSVESNLEGLYDLRALLADDNLDWDSLELFSCRSPAALPVAPPEPAPQSATSNDDLCELAPEVGPSAVELDAPAWNAALEELLLANSLACSAYVATEKISDRFPELPEFFLTQRDEFRRLLSPQILMVEENSATKLVHKTHPDYQPLSSSAALASLKIGAASDAPTTEAPETALPAAKRREYDATNADDATGASAFAEVAERARSVARQCRRLIEYGRWENGADAYYDDRELQAQESDEFARAKSSFPRSVSHRLSTDELEEAAQCYDVAAKAFDLFSQIVDLPRNQRNDSFFGLVAQAAADAQCGLKSVLSRFNVPLAADETQRSAYELLLSHCGPRGFFLENLRYQDRLTLEETLAVAPRLDALTDEFETFRARTKERRSLEGKIDYHLKKIADVPDSLYDWNKIVEATTLLCETFHFPPSSLWFRERLRDYVDKIPDETQTTDAFGRVVQEIDLVRIREEEALAAVFETQETAYSPAVQAVRDRYAGARAVFVGGTPQPHLQTRIEKRLNVRLFWSETSHGDSLERFAGLLRDDETRLFLIYIPWCSHKHSEEFAALIKDANKDCVRLRKGTNPEQIAQAICRQFRLLPESQL